MARKKTQGTRYSCKHCGCVLSVDQVMGKVISCPQCGRLFDQSQLRDLRTNLGIMLLVGLFVTGLVTMRYTFAFIAARDLGPVPHDIVGGLVFSGFLFMFFIAAAVEQWKRATKSKRR
jgi:hypothetical protein